MPMRPRVRLIIADPTKINLQRAGLLGRNDGFVMIDLRGLVYR